MKRGLLILLALVLCVSAAGAEKGLTADFPAGSAEAALAELVSEKTGLPLETAADGGPGDAANRMLADPECILCGSQKALVAGLQGYTSADLRKAMTPVCRVAVSPLYLVMDRNTAEGYGITDAETFAQYATEHEYELIFARHLGADPVDRAVTRLADEALALTDYFAEEEIPDALRSGEADAAVLTGRELTADGGDWLVLCCLDEDGSLAYPDIPRAKDLGWTSAEGEWFALFASAGIPEDLALQAADAAMEITREDLPAGYELRLMEGIELQDAVKELFADYKDYMTAEGLFFYEE